MVLELVPKQLNKYDSRKPRTGPFDRYQAPWYFLSGVNLIKTISPINKQRSNWINRPFRQAWMFFCVCLQAEQQAHWEKQNLPVTHNHTSLPVWRSLNPNRICAKDVIWTTGCFRRSSKGIWEHLPNSSTQNTEFLCSGRKKREIKALIATW